MLTNLGTDVAYVRTGVGSGTTATTAAIADIGNSINTANKYLGRMVWDTTNNRMLRASGTAAADPWHVVDGSATVTPA